MYLECSLCLTPNELPVCPIYELLQVSYFNLCIPLEFVLDYFVTELFVYGVVAGKAMFRLVCLNRLAYFMYKWTVISECDPFFFWCVCVVNECCVLVTSLFLRLWIICDGNPLFFVILSMVLHSCCLACSVIVSVIILFI